MGLHVDAVLETCLYAGDLMAAERFYAEVLGLEVYSREAGRHRFFRCGGAMFLVFDAARTRESAPGDGRLVVPPHGATGPGHVAFRVPEASFPAWRVRLADAGISIEAEIVWPGGAQSLYVRDPAGNSVELASPHLWKLSDV